MPENQNTNTSDKPYTRLPDGNQTYAETYMPTWIRYPYGVRLQSSPDAVLDSIIKLEQYIMGDDLDDKKLTDYLDMLKGSMTSDQGGMDGINQNGVTTDQEVNYYFNYPNFSDTRIGCNDVINPYWQFNRDDDICPPALIPQSVKAAKNFSTSSSRYQAENEHATGMGRVYAEVYDSQQQVVWFEAGIPKFTNIINYYRDAMDYNVAAVMNNGDLSLVGKIIGGLFKATAFIVTAGLCSVFYISRWIDQAVDERVTKYYSFSSTMSIYYAMVNSMLQYTAVSMGLHPLTLKSHTGMQLGMGYVEKGDANTERTTYEGYESVTEIDEEGYEHTTYRPKVVETEKELTESEIRKLEGIPAILRDGVDIFKIMNRKSKMIDQNNASFTVEELIDIQSSKKDQYKDMFVGEQEWDYAEDKGGWFSTNPFKDGLAEYWSTLKGSVMGSGNFVGFKVERTSISQETFTNNTGPTGLADKINSEAQAKKDELDEMGGSKTAAFGMKIAEALKDSADWKQTITNMIGGKMLEGAASALSRALGFDIGTVLQTGNGFLEIPKVWKNSSMGTRSYSLSFKLRSRYGDPVSIFQSIYIPLFLLMALSIPRAVGAHSYTGPFIIRAFCKGMFHIPVGIVTNLTISRGREEYGWSSQFLPLEVGVDMTIEDLSPQMFISMNYGTLDTFTKNSTMQAYLETLSSLGLRDMIYWYPKMVRKTYAALATAQTTIFNPSYHGTMLGKSRLGKLGSALVPFKIDRAPTNGRRF